MTQRPIDSFISASKKSFFDGGSEQDISRVAESEVESSNDLDSDTKVAEPGPQDLTEIGKEVNMPDSNVSDTVKSEQAKRSRSKNFQRSKSTKRAQAETIIQEKKRRRPTRSKTDNKEQNGNGNAQLTSSPVIVEKPKSRGRPPKALSSNSKDRAIHNDIFIEPDLAMPEPSYTGLPLEEFPSTKIKKESLWPVKTKGKKNSNPNDAGSHYEIAQEDSNMTLTSSDSASEGDYKSKLQTKLSDELTIPSEVRGCSANAKTEDLKQTEALIPETPKLRFPEEVESVRSSRRIKVISPKKTPNSKLVPQTTINDSTENGSSSDSREDNDDFCFTCGGTGVFICCDSCPRSFHFLCCDPPLQDLPENNWNCKSCTAKINKSAEKIHNNVGVFGQLMNNTEGTDAKQFRLPKYLRENTFIGISTGPHGEYQDQSFRPEPTITKLNGAQVPGFNKNDDLEINSLYDKKGKPYLCHKCGNSGLNGRSLIHCDYCPLVWHLDCFDEPLFSVKQLGSKWMCPNHVDSLIPTQVFMRRKFKDSSVLDVALHNHFLQIASMNNIIIKHDDQPYIKQDRNVPLHDYLTYESNEFTRFNTSFIEDNNFQGFDEENENEPFKVPDFFHNYSTSSGVTSKASKKLKKIITMTNREGAHYDPGAFIYRIPEKSILLDFIKHTENREHKSARGQEAESPKSEIIKDIETYEINSRLEKDEREKIFIDSVFKIKSHSPDQEQNAFSFEELVKAALHDSHINQQEENISPEEIKDLLLIKKLMKIKGKDALLKFLQT